MKNATATVQAIGRISSRSPRGCIRDARLPGPPAGAKRATAGGDLLIASSDPGWQRRLRYLLRELGAQRVDEAEDPGALEKALTEQVADVLLLDLSTGTFSLESLWIIRTLSPTTRTILLASLPDDAEAARALREGAAGYGSRETEPDLLLAAIGLVRQGGIWVAPRIILRFIEQLPPRPDARMSRDRERFFPLTARECQVAELTASGAANKEIADRLHIRERTVKAHLTNIFQKLGVSSRLRLASYFWASARVQ